MACGASLGVFYDPLCGRGFQVKNFFTGKMVKMMLIQVQFLKRELFKAMEALDEGTHRI
jgi:hypothetical protein